MPSAMRGASHIFGEGGIGFMKAMGSVDDVSSALRKAGITGSGAIKDIQSFRGAVGGTMQAGGAILGMEAASGLFSENSSWAGVGFKGMAAFGAFRAGGSLRGGLKGMKAASKDIVKHSSRTGTGRLRSKIGAMSAAAENIVSKTGRMGTGIRQPVYEASQQIKGIKQSF